MKAKRLDELKALLSSEPFLGWWRDLEEARKAHREVTARYERLLEEASIMAFRSELAQKNAIETVYRSGEAEDEAACHLAEATELENRSMGAVAAYEDQRFRASDGWIRLGAAERALEDLKERRVAALARGEEGKSELDRIDAEIQKQNREHRVAYELYERESARKTRLWAEVEALWSRSMDLTLGCAEKRTTAQRVKREAERLLAQSEHSKLEAEALRDQADAQAALRTELEDAVSSLLRRAREEFDAVVYDSFLYWGQRESDRVAYCVSLIEDEIGFNVPVRPLTIYAVGATEGVGRIEPLGPERIDVTEGDRRIEAYFLTGSPDRPDRVAAGE